MATGRTVTRWVRFGVTDSLQLPREIPINSLGPVGLTYNEEDVTAWQDAVIGFLTQQPTAAIEIGGPLSTDTYETFAASGAAPVLSGSQTLLKIISAPTFTSCLGLGIHFGVQGYWTAATDPVFGVVSPTTTNGYICSRFLTDGMTYTARFQPYPGTTPAWGTGILTSGS